MGGGSWGLETLPLVTTDLQGDLQAPKRVCPCSDTTLGYHLQGLA